MFNNNKSDFAATIGGFILVGFVAACVAMSALDYNFGFSENGYSMGSIPLFTMFLGLFVGIVCLYKAFLTEGMTFILVSLCAYLIEPGTHWIGLSIIFLVTFAIVGYMGFREGYLDLAIINGLFGICAFCSFGFTYSSGDIMLLFIGLIMLAAAVISFYVAVVEWMSAQDFIQEYEEAVFGCGDDCCCCEGGCECDDEVCECGEENCTCNKE